MDLLKDKLQESFISGQNMGKKNKKRHSSSMSTGLNYSFEEKKSGQKKKKNADLSESFEELLGSGKKKKKRHRSNTAIQLDETFEEGFDIEKPEKKKKKNRLSSVAAGINETFDDIMESKTSAKQGDKSFSSITAGPSENLEDSIAGKHQMKKKKKKKKKKLLSASATELNETFEDNSDSSPKKRKKSSDQENLSMSGDISGNTEIECVLESSFKGDPDLKSKKKKKKKCHLEEVTDGVDEHLVISPLNVKKHAKGKRLSVQEEMKNSEKMPSKENGFDIYTSDCWSVDEELSLIDSLLSKIDPEDNSPYLTTLRKINWGNIAITNRTPNECSEMIDILIRRISKFKTLAMVLKEAKEEVSDSHSRLKRVSTAKVRFINDYCKKHKSEMHTNMLRSKASILWSKLPREEKQYYETLYQNEVLKYRKSMDLPPEAPKSPFSCYYSSEIQKGGIKGNELRRKCRELFKEMKMDEKIPYLIESLKKVSSYISGYKAYKESHPDFDQPMLSIISRELFKQYFDYLGKPKPVNNVLGIFRDDLKKKGDPRIIELRNPLMKVTSLYKELSKNQKAEYTVELRKRKEMYKQSYKEWKESLNEDEALVFETYFEKKPKAMPAPKIPIGKFEFKHKVEVCMAKPKFNNEPEKPAPTPFKIFSVKFRKQRCEKYSIAKEMDKACSLAWKSLPEEAKSKYIQRCEENVAIYKDALLDYVRNLGEVAKMYLGFNRTEHYRFFKEDIFEQEFPNEEYPVYVVKKAEVGTPKAIPKSGESRIESSEVLDTKGMDHSYESAMSDYESSEEDVSDSSDDEPETNVQKLRNNQRRNTAKESSDQESSSEDEDDTDSDVAQAWEAPKKSR